MTTASTTNSTPSDRLRRVLVVYESKYGQTHKIADYCAELVRARADDVRVVHVSSVTDDELRDADLTLVLSPIYYGRPPRSIRGFVRGHREKLAKTDGKDHHRTTTAFFTVSGAGGSKALTEQQTARKTAHDFVESVGWQPSLVATFGGAIAYPKYNFLFRFLVKTTVKRHGGPTDTSRIHEATDWTEVERATYAAVALAVAATATAAAAAAQTKPESSDSDIARRADHLRRTPAHAGP